MTRIKPGIWQQAAMLMLAALAGCGGGEVAPERALAEFFPTDSGTVRFYRIEREELAHGQPTRTTVRYRRERLAGQVPDLAGRSLRLAALDTAALLEGPFAPEQTWRYYVDGQQAERYEGNERIVVLAAPLSRTRTWNGNAFNNRGDEGGPWRYTHLDTALTLAGVPYAGAVRVQQRRIANQVLRQAAAHEVYAPGAGLVLRTDEDLRYQPDGGGTLRLVAGSYRERWERLPD